MSHLVLGDQPAGVEQRHLAGVRIGDRAVPLGFAPAVEQVDGAPPHAREVLERLLQGPGQLLVVAGIDRGPHIGGRLAVQVRVAEQRIHLRRRIDQMGDQAAEGRKSRPVAVAQARLIEPVDEITCPLRHGAEQQNHVAGGHLLFQFHKHRLAGAQNRQFTVAGVCQS